MLGDLDADGDLDLAVTDSGSDQVSILLGPGDGLFASPVSYAAGDSPCSVALGDLDGDVDLDLVVADCLSQSVGHLDL